MLAARRADMAHGGFQQFPYTVTYGMAGAGHNVIDVHTAFLYVGTYRRAWCYPAENEPPLGAHVHSDRYGFLVQRLFIH